MVTAASFSAHNPNVERLSSLRYMWFMTTTYTCQYTLYFATSLCNHFVAKQILQHITCALLHVAVAWTSCSCSFTSAACFNLTTIRPHYKNTTITLHYTTITIFTKVQHYCAMYFTSILMGRRLVQL